MINLPSTAVDAPKKGNASGKVERVIRSVCDDRRDQVARRDIKIIEITKPASVAKTTAPAPYDQWMPPKINVDTMIAIAGDMPLQEQQN